MPPAREKSLENAARNRTHVIAHLFIRLDIGRAGIKSCVNLDNGSI